MESFTVFCWASAGSAMHARAAALNGALDMSGLRGEGSKARRRVRVQATGAAARLSAAAIALGDRALHGAEEQLLVERLGDERGRARLHGPGRHRHVTVAGDEDHGD